MNADVSDEYLNGMQAATTVGPLLFQSQASTPVSDTRVGTSAAQLIIDNFYAQVDQAQDAKEKLLVGIGSLYTSVVLYNSGANDIVTRSLFEDAATTLDNIVREERRTLVDRVSSHTYQTDPTIVRDDLARYDDFTATARAVQDAARTLLGYMQNPEQFADRKAKYDSIFTHRGVRSNTVTAQNVTEQMPKGGVKDLQALMADPIVSPEYKHEALATALTAGRSYDVVRALTPYVMADPKSEFKGMYGLARTTFLASLE